MSDLQEHVKINIPAKAEYIGVVRLTVSGIAYQMGFSYNDIEDIKIAIAEACNNVVSHAYKNEEGDMTIGFAISKKQLEITVSDEGKSFDANKLEREASSLHGKSLENIDVGGLGIYLMKTLMDHVKYDIRQKGITVTLTKYLNRDEVSGSESNIHQEIIQP